jgi:hypothetical protein
LPTSNIFWVGSTAIKFYFLRPQAKLPRKFDPLYNTMITNLQSLIFHNIFFFFFKQSRKKIYSLNIRMQYSNTYHIIRRWIIKFLSPANLYKVKIFWLVKNKGKIKTSWWQSSLKCSKFTMVLTKRGRERPNCVTIDVIKNIM